MCCFAFPLGQMCGHAQQPSVLLVSLVRGVCSAVSLWLERLPVAEEARPLVLGHACVL